MVVNVDGKETFISKHINDNIILAAPCHVIFKEFLVKTRRDTDVSLPQDRLFFWALPSYDLIDLKRRFTIKWETYLPQYLIDVLQAQAPFFFGEIASEVLSLNAGQREAEAILE